MKKLTPTTESWVTAIVAAITAINNIFALTGHNLLHGITSDELYNVVSAIVTVVVMAVAYWRDHPWTPEACEGTGLTRLKKAERKGKVYKEPETEEVSDDGEKDA